jgi:Domain of unknown function (DUF4252)
MKIQIAVLAGFAALWLSSAAAETRELSALPGYVNFDTAGLLGSLDPTVEINLPSPMLKFLAAAANETSDADPDVANMLGSLDHVRILVVPLDAASAPGVKSNVDRLIERLRREEWSPIIHVKEDEEAVNIYTRMAGDKMAGLALVVTDPEELVFINIVGEMDPARMGSLIGMMPGGDALSLDVLKGLEAEAQSSPPAPSQ